MGASKPTKTERRNPTMFKIFPADYRLKDKVTLISGIATIQFVITLVVMYFN